MTGSAAEMFSHSPNDALPCIGPRLSFTHAVNASVDGIDPVPYGRNENGRAASELEAST